MAKSVEDTCGPPLGASPSLPAQPNTIRHQRERTAPTHLPFWEGTPNAPSPFGGIPPPAAATAFCELRLRESFHTTNTTQYDDDGHPGKPPSPFISWSSPVHAFPIAHDHFSNIIDIADMPSSWQRHPRYFLFMALIVMATIYFLIPSQSPIQSSSFGALIRDTGLPARLERAEQVYQNVILDRKDMIRKYGPTPRHIHMCVCPSGFI